MFLGIYYMISDFSLGKSGFILQLTKKSGFISSVDIYYIELICLSHNKKGSQKWGI